MVVVGSCARQRSALGAQSRAVVPAHRLERQGGHHCVPERGFEVEQVAHELAHFVLVRLGAHLVVVLRAIGVDEQVLEVRVTGSVTGSRHRTQAPVAVAADRAGDQDTLHDRLQPEVQLERLAGRDGDHVGAEVSGASTHRVSS